MNNVWFRRVTGIAWKAYVTSILMILSGLAGLALGGAVGAFYGGQDEWINFCSDETSGRYIHDEKVRQEVCF